VRGWAAKYNFVERDFRPVVRPVSRDVFLTLPVCTIKSRKFESWNSGDATETSAFGWFICHLCL